RALLAPHAEIRLVDTDGSERAAASCGTPRGEPVALPLAYGGEQLGRLLVSPRADGPFDARDLRLLDGLATQAGPAVRPVQPPAGLRPAPSAARRARADRGAARAGRPLLRAARGLGGRPGRAPAPAGSGRGGGLPDRHRGPDQRGPSRRGVDLPGGARTRWEPR